MVKLCLVTCILATWVVVANCGHHHNAPSNSPSLPPSTDCSNIIYDMADCVPFLSNGSKEMKPEASCCSGFKTVLHTNVDCVCVAIKSSAELGIALNITKAMTLPSACGVSAPPLNNCGISMSPPGAAPANPPKSPPKSAPSPKSRTPPAAPVPPTAETPAPVAKGGVPTQAEAPSPTQSGTYSISASLAVLITMLVASFSYISV